MSHLRPNVFLAVITIDPLSGLSAREVEEQIDGTPDLLGWHVTHFPGDDSTAAREAVESACHGPSERKGESDAYMGLCDAQRFVEDDAYRNAWTARTSEIGRRASEENDG